MKEKVVTDSISELSERFIENPLDFTVEASLVAELQRIMRGRVDEEMISVEAKYNGFEKKGFNKNFTKYKEGYLEEICNQDEIHKVQIEVNIGKPSENKLVDLAVLKKNCDNENCDIKLVKGTKYFDSEIIEHAVEMKFIKNKNVPPTGICDFFENDLDKLDSLNNAKSKHLVIFSNKNIFPEIDKMSSVDKEAYSKEQERYELLAGECKERNVKLYHFCPNEFDDE